MSQESDLTKRGFEHMLARVGVDITCGGVTKKCIAGPVDRKLAVKLFQNEEQLGTVADMLNEDFAALTALALNDDNQPVTLNGEQMVVVSADRDEEDPCTHLVLRAAR